MDREELRLAQARWVLGSIYPEKLVQLACDALEAGLESDSLTLLASELRPTSATTAPLFERALAELDLPPLDQEQAKLIVAQGWARLIVEGTTAPYEGAKAIWQECCDVMGPRSRLDVFLRLASEHEDFRFAESDGLRPYTRELEACEQQILAEAQRLLATAGG